MSFLQAYAERIFTMSGTVAPDVCGAFSLDTSAALRLDLQEQNFWLGHSRFAPNPN